MIDLKKVFIFLISIVCVLTISGLWFLSKLQTQYDLKQFLPQGHPLLARDEKTRVRFQVEDSQPFVLTASVSQQTWLDPLPLQKIKQVTKEIQGLPGVKSVLSIANVQGAIHTPEGFSVGPLIESIPVSQVEKTILTNPLISPALISKNAKTTAFIVTPYELKTKDLFDLRRQLESKARKTLSFSKVLIGGVPAIQSDVGQLLHSEILHFILMGLAACFVVLAMIFSNLSPLTISFIIIALTNILVLEAMAVAGYSFSLLSSTIPILVTVDVVSLCIHTLLRFAEEKARHKDWDREKLIILTFKFMFRPNFIASMTTIVGFLALIFVDVPVIRDYGINAAGALFIGWIGTTLLIFPLLYFLPPPKARPWASSQAKWTIPLFRYPRLWIVIVFALTLFMLQQGESLSWSARLFDDLPLGHPVHLATNSIDQELGGLVPLDVEIQGAPQTWEQANKVENLQVALNSLRQMPEIKSVVGLPDLIQGAQLHREAYKWTSQTLAEVYFLYSLSNESPLKNFLNADSSSTRIAIRTKDLPANQQKELVVRIKNLTQAQFKDEIIEISGMGVTIHPLNNELSQELIFGFWKSMAAIGLILIFVFKSLRWALVACLPNLVPPAILLGLLGVNQTPIKPSVAIIFSIALGLAFNNTVYILERLRALQKKNPNKNLSIEEALFQEGNPCIISSLTLLAGFSVFMASYFPVNRIFGFYMLLSMLAGLLGDLVLLPTLIKVFPWLLQPLRWSKRKAMASINILLVISGLLLIPNSTWSISLTVKQIGQEMAKKLKSRDEEFLAQMKILEADGSSKDRVMHVSRLSPEKKDHAILVRMQVPLDLRGTSLLATFKGDHEEKWIYLPSTKQTRRLSGGNTSGGLLGSELNAEDFDFSREYSTSSVLKNEIEIQGKKFFVIESDVNKNSANYSKILSYVSATDYLPVKIYCFDKKGQLLKVIEVFKYSQIATGKWRAGLIKIKNVQNKRGTEIAISKVQLNQNLKASYFTPKSLSSEE